MDTPNNNRAIMEKLLDNPRLLESAVNVESFGMIGSVVGEELVFMWGGNELNGWEFNGTR